MGALNAGQLRERVTLLTTAEPVEDGRGGSVASGPDVERPVWARVRPLSGRELLTLGQVTNSLGYEITIRNYQGYTATAKQRVRWQQRTLDVQSAIYDENREFVKLTCLDSGQ